MQELKISAESTDLPKDFRRIQINTENIDLTCSIIHIEIKLSCTQFVQLQHGE